MCSIFGVYAKDPLGGADVERLTRAHQSLSHRGPDASGTYESTDKTIFFGHNRLSIIDLDPRSNQPFRIGPLSIVFNGEIYNYKELQAMLRARGHVFVTDSDTEVILVLYKEFKEQCLDRLRGMFAFAIYDERTKELFCARDRVGEKPFIFAETERGFVFASEIPALFASGFVAPEENDAAMPLLYAGNFKHIPAPYAAWKGIAKLEPGEYMTVRAGAVQKKAFYWKPRGTYRRVTPEEVRRDVIEAIRLTTVADVPIGLLLSGGLDSSIIASVLAKELHQDFQAFVFGRDEEDEEILRAKRVADFLGIPLVPLYFKDIKEKALSMLGDIIEQYGEPLHLLPLVYSSVLYGEIKARGIKVVLTGNGADELFFGYTAHNRTILFSYAKRIIDALPDPIRRALAALRSPFFGRDHIAIKERLLLDSLRARGVDGCGAIERFMEHERGFFSALLPSYYIDFSNTFGLLVENAHSSTMIGDIAGLRHGVEVRAPFLDYKLLELALCIRPGEKVGRLFDSTGRYNKQILRRAFEKDLPKETLANTKMGFGFSIGERALFPDGGPAEFGRWAYAEWKKRWSTTHGV